MAITWIQGKKMFLQKSYERNSDKQQQPPLVSFISSLPSPLCLDLVVSPTVKLCCAHFNVYHAMFISYRVRRLYTMTVSIKFSGVFNWKLVRNLPTPNMIGGQTLVWTLIFFWLSLLLNITYLIFDKNFVNREITI